MAAKPPRGVGPLRHVREAVSVLAALTAILVLALLAANTGFGRGLIERQLDGLSVGALGRLHVAGLEGDLWSDLSLKELSLSDRSGVWLRADRLRLRWTPSALVQRRFAANLVSADQITVLRRPVLTQTPPRQDRLPLSFDLRSIRFDLTTLPAFSVVDGRYRVQARVKMRRQGAMDAQLAVTSLLHAGDGLNAKITAGHEVPLFLTLKAVEAQGGALAGMLGLPARQPFVMDFDARGQDGAGSATLLAKTGPTVVVSGKGIWSAQGGTADAELDLKASSLTAPLASHVGPRLLLTLKGPMKTSSVQLINAALRADNLSLDVNGAVNTRTLTIEKAASVTAQSPNLSRGLDQAYARAGRFEGSLSGQPKAWRLDGRLRVDQVRTQGYGLAQVQGPLIVEQSDKGLSLDLDLVGSGGQGTNAVASLLGARPAALAHLERLPDGQVLLRSLKASGSGLTIDASGRRSLLGGLVLDAEARLNVPSAGQARTSGLIVASGSARTDGFAKPWTFRSDAQASGLKTGFEIADHLLGPTPRLKAQGIVGAAFVQDLRLDLEGAATSAELRGAVARGGQVTGAVNWRAKGPLPVGPVIIDGAASGLGKVSGTLAAPRVVLSALIDNIALPAAVEGSDPQARFALTQVKLDVTAARGKGGWDGAFDLAADSVYGPAKAHTGLHLVGDGLDLKGLAAEMAGIAVAGDLSLRGASPTTSQLTFAVGPGLVLTSGRVEGSLGLLAAKTGAQSHLDLILTATDAHVRGQALVIGQGRLTAIGPLNHSAYVLTARGQAEALPFRLDGQGVAGLNHGAAELTFTGKGRVKQADLTTLDPLQLSLSAQAITARGRISIGGGEAHLEASRVDETLKARLDLDRVDLGALGEDLAGQISGQLALDGKGSHLGGDFSLNLKEARASDAPASLALEGWVKGHLNDERLTVEAQASTGKGLRAITTVALPAQASAAPFRIALVRDRPLSGRLDMTGEIKPIWDLFFSGDQRLSGTVTAQGTLSGTLNQPQVLGHLDLSKGTFDDAGTGLRLRNLSAQADATVDQLDIRGLTAGDDAGGTVSGEGRIGLARGSASSFVLALKRFRLIDNEQVTAFASGSAKVTRGADGKAALVGDLTLDRADVAADAKTSAAVVQIDVIERNRPVSEDAPLVEASKVPPVALDVRLHAERGVFVRGRGLDMEMALNAQVSGTTAVPVLSGQATIVRGDYDFAGKRFAFDDRSVVYLATRPDRIRLDLTATREDNSLTAVIVIRGTAARPVITLTSTPVLPNDEVLSEVLFGRSASQLSPLEAAQLASAVTGLARGGGFDVIGNLRSFAGLDRLAFGGGGTQGVTVSGGKYLTDNVYLELTGGGRDGPTAQVEWRIRKRLAIVSRIAGQGDGKLSVRWRTDQRREPPAPRADSPPLAR
jgi:translocation and assembly module TamB